MREILFRGKTNFEGRESEWLYGSLLAESKNTFPIIARSYDNDEDWISVDEWGTVAPESVGQYTGLTDRNGKKIFEGDIVRADDYIFSVKYGKCGGTQNAENYGYMGFYLEAVSEGTKLCAKYGLRDDMCYFTDIKVIGNIHDNPELLN